MNELRTCESIIKYFYKKVQNKEIIPPEDWINGSQMANVLVGDETDKLFDLQQEVNILKREAIKSGDSVAKAKTVVESTDEYKEYCKQKAKIDQVTEFVRIAKLMSRLKSEEFRQY